MSTMKPSQTAQQPTKPLSYPDAISYLKRWLEAEILTADERAKGVTVSIVDYFDGDPATLTARPWCGVRVAEVDFHTERGGASYMQVEAPIGLAVCAQAERCILALIEGWNGETQQSWETDEEFDRLRCLFDELRQQDAAATPTSEPALTELVRLVFSESDVLGMAEDEGVPDDVALARARDWSTYITERASALINEQFESVVRSNQP